ncbi:MAG: SAF domain-containing protein, partial [Solirubrobacterales bacterium]
MSRRARAVAFFGLSAGCAALAAAVANGYGTRVAQGFGSLREVVVVVRQLPAGEPIGRAQVSGSLEVRRIPGRFVPPGALASPHQALGQEPAAVLPAGSYLVAAQLRLPAAKTADNGPRLGSGRRPVEIAVGGGEARVALGGSPEGS